MKEYTAYDLIDFLETDVTITCMNCGAMDGYWHDEEEYFFDKGWRATRQKVYCPICAKKKLKNIK